MRIVNSQAMLVWATPEPAKVIERIARVCYKSEEKITDSSAGSLIRMLIERGHLAMIEHASASLHFICDRGVSHEIVRHRLASFAQESTRYCNYGKDKFGCEITVIKPPDIDNDVFEAMASSAESDYMFLLKGGHAPQTARAVLPNCLKTEIVMTANFREWLHFLELRCSKAAHPQMREVAFMARDILRGVCPEVFSIEKEN
ncbi:MAG: FAD-dependent thymidylate synthase [Bryobacteraceae bacterium]